MKSKGFILVAVLLAGLVCLPGMALADYSTYASRPVNDVTWFNEGADGNLGTSFSTSSPFTVYKLGFYDSGSPGLNYSHDVGLWNASGALLGQVTIAAGTTAPLEDGFRWANLSSPVLLSTGTTYVLGATMKANDTSDLVGSSATINSPFTLISALYHDNGVAETYPTLHMPDTAWTTPGFFGPNLATPIPPTVWMLGAGLMGIGVVRKRIKW